MDILATHFLFFNFSIHFFLLILSSFGYFPSLIPSTMAEIIAPVLSAFGIVGKLVPFFSKFRTVEVDLLAFHANLQHYQTRLEYLRIERSHKIHLLDPRTLSEVDSILQDSQFACNQITALIADPLNRIKKKGKVNIGQRVKWVLLNAATAKAVKDFQEITYLSLTTLHSLLLSPLPNSEIVSAMQSKEHDPRFIYSTSKPSCPTIRAISSPLQMGQKSDGEIWSRRPISSIEYGSIGLGDGVVDRPQSAGPPIISSKLEDHIWGNEYNIGSFLACREIALSRRQ